MNHRSFLFCTSNLFNLYSCSSFIASFLCIASSLCTSLSGSSISFTYFSASIGTTFLTAFFAVASFVASLFLSIFAASFHVSFCGTLSILNSTLSILAASFCISFSSILHSFYILLYSLFCFSLCYRSLSVCSHCSQYHCSHQGYSK